MADENTQTTQADPIEERFKSFEAEIRADPSKIPDKYRDADPEKSVAKAVEGYKAMYADYTRAKQQLAELQKASPETQQKPASEAPAGDTPLGIPEPPKAPDGSLWTKVQAAVATTGDLPADLRGELTKQGIPEEIIDTTINGFKVQRQQILTEASTLVGGSDRLKAIQEWAAKTLTPAEAKVADAALKSPAWKTTLLGLKAQYEAAQVKAGEPAPTPQGTPAYGTGGLKPFASQHEYMSAVASQRYKVDPSFQEEVKQRLWLTRQRQSGG